jgi:hypothetical protein
MENSDPVEFRIGIFFYLISAVALVLFIASDFAEKAEFDYLFVSLVLFGIGWFFRRKIPPPQRVERFIYAKRFFGDMIKKIPTKKK